MVWLSMSVWVKVLNILFVLIDISTIAFLIYKGYDILSYSKAEQIIVGVIMFVAIYIITNFLQLHTCKWILDQIGSVIVLALIILFQPEIRQILTNVGENFKKVSIKDEKDIEEIMKAVQQMSILKVGALIVFEKSTGLKEYIKTGTILNAKITAPLILSIFKYGTPLHDGAIIIKNDQIVAAACYLPVSSSDQISRDLGTRHRAALGMSQEVLDCVVIVVSEETGKISLAYEGRLYTNYDIDMLRSEVTRLLGTNEDEADKENQDENI